MARGVFHWDPERKCIVDGPAPSGARKVAPVAKRGSDGAISFQLPEGYDDGSGKLRHLKSGPHKGRVYFTSRQEQIECAKRVQDRERVYVRTDK